MPYTGMIKAVKDVLQRLSPRSRLLPPISKFSNQSLRHFGTSTPNVLEQPIRSAVKRPSDEDNNPPAKRQKITQQKHEKPIYKLKTVFLKYEGLPMAEVPLRNFRRLASEKVKDLDREIFESNTHRWKLYTFGMPRLYGLYAKERIENWVSWLTHSDLRAVVRGDSWDDKNIEAALVDARDLDDVGYQDALVDALIAWIRKEESPGSIDVKWLRRNNERFFRYHDCLKAIGIALIWHHDRAGVGKYDSETRYDIQETCVRYLNDLEPEPNQEVAGKHFICLSDLNYPYCSNRGFHAIKIHYDSNDYSQTFAT
ncbi:hypothetical protein KCU98_g2391, partial [Aureobasidium melanogenum]